MTDSPDRGTKRSAPSVEEGVGEKSGAGKEVSLRDLLRDDEAADDRLRRFKEGFVRIARRAGIFSWKWGKRAAVAMAVLAVDRGDRRVARRSSTTRRACRRSPISKATTTRRR